MLLSKWMNTLNKMRKNRVHSRERKGWGVREVGGDCLFLYLTYDAIEK